MGQFLRSNTAFCGSEVREKYLSGELSNQTQVWGADHCPSLKNAELDKLLPTTNLLVMGFPSIVDPVDVHERRLSTLFERVAGMTSSLRRKSIPFLQNVRIRPKRTKSH